MMKKTTDHVLKESFESKLRSGKKVAAAQTRKQRVLTLQVGNKKKSGHFPVS